jgi:hypothetical protein
VTLEDHGVPRESGAQVVYLRRISHPEVGLAGVPGKKYGKQGLRIGCESSKMWRDGQEQKRDGMPHVL